LSSQSSVHLDGAPAEEPAPRYAGQEQLDAVVDLVEEVGPLRPRGFEAAQQVSNLGDVDQLAWIVVVAVDDERHLAPVEPSVLAGRQKHLQARQHGCQVARLDLASRDHENCGFGNAGAEIKAWVLGHAAILALGFSTCLVISATLAIRLQHPHAGYAALFIDQTRC